MRRFLVLILALTSVRAFAGDPDGFPVTAPPAIDAASPAYQPLPSQDPATSDAPLAVPVQGADASASTTDDRNRTTADQPSVPASPQAEAANHDAATEPAAPAEQSEGDHEHERPGMWVRGVAVSFGGAVHGAWHKMAHRPARGEVTVGATAVGSLALSTGSSGPVDPPPGDPPAPAPIQPDRLVAGVVVNAGTWRPLAIPSGEPPPPGNAYPQVPPPRPPAPQAVAPPPPAPVAAAPAHLKPKWRFDQHTLVGLRKRSGRFGVYFAASGTTADFGGEATGGGGFEGGFVLASHFAVGGAVYGTDCFDANNQVVNFVYGGVQPGLILWTRSVIHPRFDLLLGGGTVYDHATGRVIGHAGVTVPRLAVELNVTRAIRVSGDLAWRSVAAPANVRAGFSGMQAGLSLRVGWL